MVFYTLSIKADIEGIDSIQFKQNTAVCVSVRNPVDHNEVRERIVIDPTTLVEPVVPNHLSHRLDGPYHMALKWDRHDKKQNATIRIFATNAATAATTDSNSGTEDDDEKQQSSSSKKGSTNSNNSMRAQAAVRPFHSTDNGINYVPIAVFDCDGLEPYAFHPNGNEFVVTTKGGAVLQDVELTHDGKDWSFYDLSHGTSAIINLTSKFE